jgi:uncharacterized membrane protein
VGAYGPFFVLLAAIVTVVVLLLVLGTQSLWASSTPSDDSDPARLIDRNDARYWYAGMFYYNPDDPDAFIPKRSGLGWTLNFAHPRSKLVALIIVAAVLLPVTLAIIFSGIPIASIGHGCQSARCR